MDKKNHREKQELRLQEKAKTLQENELYFQRLMEISPHAIFIMNPEGRLIMANSQAALLFDYKTPTSLIGKNLFNLIRPEDQKKAITDQEATLQNEVIQNTEYAFVRQDGSFFIGELNASRIDDDQGKPEASIVVVKNASYSKMAIKSMLNAERFESMGILAGGIAHDFNNIMMGILGNIDLARNTITEDPLKAIQRLDDVEKGVLNAKHLTQQLLTFSKWNDTDTKPMDLAPLLKETAYLALSGTTIEVRYSIPERLSPIDINEGQIKQVISNLVINAVQAMPRGGQIEIEARERFLCDNEVPLLRSGKYIEFFVIDHGRGISKKNLDKVFEPYFTTKPQGTGLGLATCYSIIHNHKGTISVDSIIDEGTTFRVLLPVSQGTVTFRQETLNKMKNDSGGRVLIMDDDDIVRDVAVHMLVNAGFKATGARDGSEAIEQYCSAREKGDPYNAVILDLTVPGGMGGKEALNLLRKIDPEVKAIVTSGYSNDPIMSEFALFGFHGVVAKPYTLTELQNTVLSVIQPQDKPSNTKNF